MATTYRTCPRTGLQFDLDADKLMRWNAVAGVLWLLVGGITALLVILTRWPAIKLLPADQFYLILTAHGIDMLILWILFFEMAVLYFASSTLLRCRLATPKVAWLGFWLMVIGGIMTNVAIFQGGSSVMFTSYVPMQAAPHFYLGIILVAVGALVVQVLVIRPRLTRRSDAVLAGADGPRSHGHYAYVGFEAIKAVALLVGGILLLTS